jgi:hypothetical protein
MRIEVLYVPGCPNFQPAGEAPRGAEDLRSPSTPRTSNRSGRSRARISGMVGQIFRLLLLDENEGRSCLVTPGRGRRFAEVESWIVRTYAVFHEKPEHRGRSCSFYSIGHELNPGQPVILNTQPREILIVCARIQVRVQ